MFKKFWVFEEALIWMLDKDALREKYREKQLGPSPIGQESAAATRLTEAPLANASMSRSASPSKAAAIRPGESTASGADAADTSSGNRLSRAGSPVKREASPVKREASPVKRQASPVKREASPVKREYEGPNTLTSASAPPLRSPTKGEGDVHSSAIRRPVLQPLCLEARGAMGSSPFTPRHARSPAPPLSITPSPSPTRVRPGQDAPGT